MSNEIIKEIKKAINTEAEGFAFYNFAKDLVRDKKGKAVFKQLANDELDHIRVLTSLSENLTRASSWISYQEALRQGVAMGEEKTPIFPSIDEVKSWLGEKPTDIDAIKFGIDIEEKAVDYYARAREKAKDEGERSFFETMVKIETGHLNLLQWEYDSLTNSGFWCDHQEFDVEG